MTNLRALSIQSSEDFTIMKGLVNMHKLNTLCIDGASSKPRHFNYISNLTTLTHLTLKGCRILKEIFLHLTALTNVKELVLDRSFFVGEDESGYSEIGKRIKELTSLRDLEVLKMEFMNTGETDLIGFKKLMQLTMEHLPLAFELPPNLKSLKVGVLDATIDKYINKFINLESLNVRLEYDETNKTFENVSKLKQLTRLRIMGPFKNINERGLNALELLPRLKVLSFRLTEKKTITAKIILKIISNIPSLIEFHCNNEKYIESIRVPYMLCKQIG